MALRALRLEEDDLLRKKSKVVKNITENVKMLLDDMLDTMRSKEGVGLAAPQVGILKRIVIIDVGDENGLLELINPEIIEQSGCQSLAEGCLSIPGKSGYVDRPEYVKVKALNRNGEEIIVEGREILAVALCHEIDHLDGVLYIDKVKEYINLDDEETDDYEEE